MAVMDEAARALRLPRIRRRLREPDEAPRWLADIAVLADVIEEAGPVQPITRDPDDDRVLASAVAGRAEIIVSGDEDLLVLREHDGVLIMSPRAFLSLL